MTTISSVNKALKKAGIDAELVKGRGYFWFDGEEASGLYSNSVSVFRVTDLTEDQWVKEYQNLKEDSDRRRGIFHPRSNESNTMIPNPEDSVSLNAPLLLRLLELAGELKTDVQMHMLAEDVLAAAREGRGLNMEDYERISKRSRSLPAAASKIKSAATVSIEAFRKGPEQMSSYRKGAVYEAEIADGEATKKIRGMYMPFALAGKTWSSNLSKRELKRILDALIPVGDSISFMPCLKPQYGMFLYTEMKKKPVEQPPSK